MVIDYVDKIVVQNDVFKIRDDNIIRMEELKRIIKDIIEKDIISGDVNLIVAHNSKVLIYCCESDMDLQQKQVDYLYLVKEDVLIVMVEI